MLGDLQEMQDLQRVSGLVHDMEPVVAATVRALIDKYPWMADVPCAAHGFNNLCKDLGKDVPALRDTFEGDHLIIKTIIEDKDLRTK